MSKTSPRRAFPLLLGASLLILASSSCSGQTPDSSNAYATASGTTTSITAASQGSSASVSSASPISAESATNPTTAPPTEASQTSTALPASGTSSTVTTTAAATTATGGPDNSVSGLGGISTYTLSNLPTGRVVQQFAFAVIGKSTYIFATQSDGSTTYLSRCQVALDGKQAPCIDYAVLEGYGHAESLDISVHNGTVYLYLTSDANMDSGNYYWGTTITRLKYDKGQISDVRKITGTGCATSDGSPLKKGQAAYRINFALNDAADRMVVYFRSQSGTHALSVYRLSALQKMLDESAEIHLKDCSSAFIASTGAKKIADICPTKSFQGLGMGPDGSILLTGGTTSTKPLLTKFAVRGSSVELASSTAVDWMYSDLLGTQNWAAKSSFYEIESIKCFQGKEYVTFNPGSSARIKNHTEIYRLAMR